MSLEHFPLLIELGFRLTDKRAGWNRFELEVEARHLNPNGVLYGALTFGLGDAGMGLALTSLLGDGATCASLDCRVTFQRAVRVGERLVAESGVTERGRRVAFCESVVRRDADGSVVSRIAGTFAIRSRRAGSTPPPPGARHAPVYRALTIAGSDSGGGAGIQADLKTFEAFRVFGTSALTAVTAQNTCEVAAVQALPPSLVSAQIGAVAGDIGVDAVKTGMLVDGPTIAATAAALIEHLPDVPLIVDPVMVAKSGAELLSADARQTLLDQLLTLAELVTPNLPEAAALAGGAEIGSPAEAAEVARALVERGAGAALVKGGHAAGDEITDTLFADGRLHQWTSPRLPTRHTHGTGCTLSAAICALRARGTPLLEAVTRARNYLGQAIERAPGLGQGHGPLQHAFLP